MRIQPRICTANFQTTTGGPTLKCTPTQNGKKYFCYKISYTQPNNLKPREYVVQLIAS